MSIFDPKLHPRDTRGRWASALNDLKQGESAHLPDGIHVKRGSSGFHVQMPDGSRHKTLKDAASAGDHALYLSARNNHAQSLGGNKRHASLPDALKRNRAVARRESRKAEAAGAKAERLKRPTTASGRGLESGGKTDLKSKSDAQLKKIAADSKHGTVRAAAHEELKSRRASSAPTPPQAANAEVNSVHGRMRALKKGQQHTHTNGVKIKHEGVGTHGPIYSAHHNGQEVARGSGRHVARVTVNPPGQKKAEPSAPAAKGKRAAAKTLDTSVIGTTKAKQSHLRQMSDQQLGDHLKGLKKSASGSALGSSPAANKRLRQEQKAARAAKIEQDTRGTAKVAGDQAKSAAEHPPAKKISDLPQGVQRSARHHQGFLRDLIAGKGNVTQDTIDIKRNIIDHATSTLHPDERSKLYAMIRKEADRRDASASEATNKWGDKSLARVEGERATKLRALADHLEGRHPAPKAKPGKTSSDVAGTSKVEQAKPDHSVEPPPSGGGGATSITTGASTVHGTRDTLTTHLSRAQPDTRHTLSNGSTVHKQTNNMFHVLSHDGSDSFTAGTPRKAVDAGLKMKAGGPAADHSVEPPAALNAITAGRVMMGIEGAGGHMWLDDVLARHPGVTKKHLDQMVRQGALTKEKRPDGTHWYTTKQRTDSIEHSIEPPTPNSPTYPYPFTLGADNNHWVDTPAGTGKVIDYGGGHSNTKPYVHVEHADGGVSTHHPHSIDAAEVVPGEAHAPEPPPPTAAPAPAPLQSIRPTAIGALNPKAGDSVVVHGGDAVAHQVRHQDSQGFHVTHLGTGTDRLLPHNTLVSAHGTHSGNVDTATRAAYQPGPDHPGTWQDGQAHPNAILHANGQTEAGFNPPAWALREPLNGEQQRGHDRYWQSQGSKVVRGAHA